jgi:hypothetical protein
MERHKDWLAADWDCQADAEPLGVLGHEEVDEVFSEVPASDDLA